MKNENYINIQGWMINELKLKGNELILFALIYGFSQDGQSNFYGSLSYLQEFLRVSRPTVIALLRKLSDKKLITKTEESHYMVVKKLYHPSKETLPVASKETLLNNNNTTNNNIANEVCDEFSSKEYIHSMLTNKNRHIRVIAWYFEQKKLDFPSKTAVQDEIKRWVKDAKVVAEYENGKLQKAINKAIKDFPDNWKLSTIKKYLPETK